MDEIMSSEENGFPPFPVKETKVRLAEWLREKAKDAGAQGFVLGLSGGVDSSVVAALARLAAGDSVLGVIMPCNSSESDEEHARLISKRFGIVTEYVDLSRAYGVLKQSLPPGSRIAEANLKPRLRMLTLYYFANLNNYLVLGTGNKTELMLGYFTKYGDGGVDLLPIAGLYKHQVRELARDLLVPEPIISKPPSAGLWEGQTDEGEIGLSYDDMDRILMALEKGGTKDVDGSKLAKVKAMMERSRHKKRMPEIFEPRFL